MPLYDFACPACDARFEALVAIEQVPPCPACGHPGPERLFSPIAAAPKAGLHGGDARRSDSRRRARDAQLREGLAAKREARRQSGP
ncbi:MAG TPA: zinc ribbon domain-containing protein, partial [Solirubrobacteraceae bacterium]|nr:zinc ribbon domain-containing protein [Solirubrobacteraceae bacterium]